MNGTLPLFEELEPPDPSQAFPGGSRSPAADPQPVRASPEPSALAAARERHLRAAWRLARAMKRFPDRSAEQTRAGVAICRHLQALLARAEEG